MFCPPPPERTNDGPVETGIPPMVLNPPSGEWYPPPFRTMGTFPIPQPKLGQGDHHEQDGLACSASEATTAAVSARSASLSLVWRQKVAALSAAPGTESDWKTFVACSRQTTGLSVPTMTGDGIATAGRDGPQPAVIASATAATTARMMANHFAFPFVGGGLRVPLNLGNSMFAVITSCHGGLFFLPIDRKTYPVLPIQ